MSTITQPTAPTADKFDRVWAPLPSADRVVLLGHNRPDLTPAHKIRGQAPGINARVGAGR